MSHLPISDLRTQRDLVKRHLDWLDARIAEAAAGEPPAAPASAPETAAAPTAATATPAMTPLGASTEIQSEPDALPPETEAVAEQLLSTYAAAGEPIPTSAKNGCIAAAVIFVLLFLFVLFGLPYFLYKDKKAAPPDAPLTGGEMSR